MTTKEFEVLLEEHGARELSESFIFPVKLKAKAKSESETTLRNLLAERSASISPEDKLKADLLQMRFQIEDHLKKRLA